MGLHVRELVEQQARGDDGIDPALRQRAYHGAGHAAMEIVTGGIVRLRSMALRRRSRGRCSYLNGPHLEVGATAERLENVITCLLAGFLTETVLCAGLVPVWLSSFDIGLACAWAEHVGGSAGQAGVDRVQRLARDRVLANWDLIDALAAALLTRGRLRVAEITTIAEGVVAARRADGEDTTDA